jgi:hypothetical protein
MEVLFSSNERQSGYLYPSLDSSKIDVIAFSDRCIWIGRSAREGLSATGLLHPSSRTHFDNSQRAADASTLLENCQCAFQYIQKTSSATVA